jgi:hypothetical protein
LNDDLLNDFLLEAFPNPERKGCPDEKTLRAFAEDRLPPGNPVLQHVSSCSECYAEYRHYRQDLKDASKKNVVAVPSARLAVASGRNVQPWAIAAGILFLLGSGLYVAKQHHSQPESASVASNVPPVAATVDLFNAVTVRGGGGENAPMPLQEVSLPSSVVNLQVTLPRFSESGPYGIVVAKDRAGSNIVARGFGNAVDVDGKVSVSVALDLRNATPGMYFLATVRGSDNGTYYYPLKVN